MKKISFLDAYLHLALASINHGTDEAIRKQAAKCLMTVETKYQYIILQIMNHPHPLAYVRGLIATLPDRILTMPVGRTPAGDAAQSTRDVLSLKRQLA